jgi:hypothetical protein
LSEDDRSSDRRTAQPDALVVDDDKVSREIGLRHLGEDSLQGLNGQLDCRGPNTQSDNAMVRAERESAGIGEVFIIADNNCLFLLCPTENFRVWSGQPSRSGSRAKRSIQGAPVATSPDKLGAHSGRAECAGRLQA